MTDRIFYASTRLLGEEGVRAHAYNDATGETVTCKPNGNLSIGAGIDLEVGLDEEEMQWLLAHRLGKVDTGLRQFSWYLDLDEPRGSVFLDVGFNLGVGALLLFVNTIHYATIGDWPLCSAALLQSKAAEQLPARYKKLSQIILTGVP